MRASGKGIISRIEKRLKALGLTENSASSSAGLSRDAIRSIRRNIESGKQRGVSSETLEKLAPVLQTSKAWLLSGDGPEVVGGDHIESGDILQDSDDRSKTVRVVGYVGASGEAVYYRFSDDQFEYVEPPPGATDQTVAVEVRGGSLGDAFKSWLVFYRDIRSPVTEDLYNQLCVVGLADDRILVKIIKHERNGSFTLLSNANVEPPIEDAGIEWASKVTDMRPR
jgi:transcriptional regulator with XRE-family HTH domain